jgi:hypothetical protein
MSSCDAREALMNAGVMPACPLRCLQLLCLFSSDALAAVMRGQFEL